jgi:type I restriction enzyme S subunit
MSEWKEIKFKELATFSQGIQVDIDKQQVEPFEKSVRFIRIVDFTKSSSDEVRYIENPGEKYLVNEKDLVMIRYGSQTAGKIARGFKGAIANNTFKITLNENYLDKDYVFYYLSQKSIFEYFHTSQASSTMPAITFEMIGNLEVSFPNIPEQRSIASILSSLDDKIDLLHRQNATLEKMAETLFRQWFVERRPEPVEGDAKEEWKEGRVSDYALHLKDSIQPQKNPSTFYFHYSISSFDNGRIPITELGEEVKSNKYKVPKNCILFSKLNPHKEKRVWLLQDEVEENSICSTEFQVVFPKNKQHLYFLYGWLTFNENYNEIASGVGGTSGSHQRIDPKAIYEFQCPLISDSVIENFNVKIKPIFMKQVINQNQIRTLTALRDTLLPKLMSGEITVNQS